MVHLVSVHDQFHARVITARLGSDGIPIEVRPPLGGPYPLLGEVHLYVGENDIQLARDLLRADEDDAGPPPDDVEGAAPLRRPLLGQAVMLGLTVVLLVALVLLAVTRAG